MGTAAYAVCEQCAFLRAFSRSTSRDGDATPSRCPACGQEIRVHSREERFPSAYVSRVSRSLYATPPLRV